MKQEKTLLDPSTEAHEALTDIIEWAEPYGDGPEAVVMRMTASDVAKVRRRQEHRYESDEDAIEDFMIVHWATRKAAS